MKLKVLIVLTVLLVILVGFAGYLWYGSTYITIDETVYRRDITEADFSGRPVAELEKLPELTALRQLDLRHTGLTVAEYEALRQALPECRIQWSVPFQGGYCSEEAMVISVTELAAEDLAMLAYLPQLKTVDASGCRDYAVLAELEAARPDLEVIYTIAVGGEERERTTTELTLENADGEALQAVLPYLKELNTVTFTGAAPDGEQIYEMMCLRPDVTFVWDFEVCGVAANSLDTELYLNDIPMESVDEVENALKFFYDLQWVEMCGCGIPSEEMDAMGKRHPETRFIWTVYVGSVEMRTDAIELMPLKHGYNSKWRKFTDEYCQELKYCTDIICMDIGHSSVLDLSFLEYMPNLQYLVVADTEIQDFSALQYLENLVFLELFLTDFDQAEVLTGLTNLQDLNIGYSGLENYEPLLEMVWLDRLWLPGNGFTKEEQQIIRDALPDTIVEFYGQGSTDKGWRESPNYYAMRDILGMPYMTG